MPKVSVIIPTWNPGDFLREAIRSVYAQTFDDWELVVVDDASTVDLSWVEREFPRARLVRQPRGGVSVGRNNGILGTTGELIAFMDHDDLWLPTKLADQVAAFAAHPTAAICYCDLEIVNEHGERVATANNPLGTEPADATPRVELDGSVEPKPGERSNTYRAVQFFSTHFITPSCVMLRRAALATSGLLDPFIPFSGDYDLIIKLGSKHPVVHVPRVDTLYRKHSANFSDQYDVGRAELSALIGRYEAYARGQGDKELARDARKLFGRPRKMFSAQAYDCARRSLKHKDYKQVAYHLARAAWFSPPFVAGAVASYALGRGKTPA
jgi:glycosyltransferase involved in cell wall biosynthesis